MTYVTWLVYCRGDKREPTTPSTRPTAHNSFAVTVLGLVQISSGNTLVSIYASSPERSRFAFCSRGLKETNERPQRWHSSSPSHAPARRTGAGRPSTRCSPA